MTLSALTSRTSYPGTGSVGPFAIPFRIQSSADLLVTKQSSAGVETPFILSTNYTVDTALANVTLVTALVAGETIVIRRKPALTQLMSIRNQGSYFPATIEDECDRLEMQLQALQDQLDRSVGLSESYDPATFNLRIPPGVAGQVLGWSSPTALTSMNVSAGAVALPGNSRTVTTLSSYLADNAVFNTDDYAVAGDADDGARAIRASTALQAAGGGILVFPARTHNIYKVGTVYGPLASFVNLKNVAVYGHGAVLALDPTRVYVAAYGQLFLFTGCDSIEVDGFNVTGPVMDITGTTVTGVEFVRVIGPTTNVSMPMNKVQGVLSGVSIAGGPALKVQNVKIGLLDVKQAFYGFNAQNAGDNVTIDTLKTDTIHRSYFIYGVRNHKVNVISKDASAIDCIIRTYDSGNDTEDIDLTYSRGTDTTNSSDNSASVQLSWVGTSRGCTLRNIKIKYNINWAGAGQTGAEALQIIKLLGDESTSDTVDRGHVLDGLTVGGTLRGTPHYSASGLLSTYFNCVWGTGDFWYNLAFRDLRISSTALAANMRMGALAGRLTLENLISNTEIGMTEAALGLWPPKVGRYQIINCDFPNQFVNGGSFKAMEHINYNGNFTLDVGYSGHKTTSDAAGADIIRTLPVSVPGLEYTAQATAAGRIYMTPAGSEIVGAGGAGKYLIVPAHGSVKIRCYIAGVWEIESSNGAITYQP